MNKLFEKKSLLNFLKQEYQNGNKSYGKNNKFTLFTDLIFLGTINYFTKIEWIKRFNIIEKSIVNFYENVEIKTLGAKPSLIKDIKNHNENIISFNFHKAHIAITNKSLYFFPITENIKTNFVNEILERYFKIDLIGIPYNRHCEFNNMKLIDINFNKEETILVIKIEELTKNTELIMDRKLTIANNG